ncbi:OstA-like protein [Muriicola jejuensis]|uniref:OstA-like protein n=1 Tax=Muriicola jejuensis TaxID=504488 RepID=UPI0024B655ED|nr:OstA-like protein [Muriicola jejuensis]
MKGIFCILFLCFSLPWLHSQDKEAQPRQINIVYGANFTKDEARYPGASIFSKDDRQVQFEHQGADLWCDIAIFYQKENKLRAIGNIRLVQGDSILMTSGKIDYDGNEKLAKAWEKVLLKNADMTLRTDTLFFDRENQEAYYRSNGTIVDSTNTLTSKIGRYFMEPKKYQFLQNVKIRNPEYTVESSQLDYYTLSKNAYMYGPSTITGKTYTLYCERGFYDTKVETGYGIKNTRINYNNRIIEGDSVYFNKAKEFASATNNIKVTDTINDGVIRAHYAEVYKARDSVFATKRAVSVSLVEQDSLYIHGDTLMITGKPDQRILRAFRNTKFYKTDLSGKCDSLHFEQRTGITQLIRKPVLWNLENQMTGDSIHLISDMETEKLDSLKVLNNAFVISQDTIGKVGFNQAKGKDLFGKFIENELKIADLVKNTEVIYYMYNDDQELIGINKTICSSIRLTFENSDIEDITFFTNPDGDIFPETELPESSRQLKGFVWRGDERIRSMEEIFDEDDNTLVLPKIRGVDNPIDTDADPAISELEKKARDYVNSADPNAVPVPEEKPLSPPEKAPERITEVRAEPGIAPGYYLIANVFEEEENFARFSRMLSDRGIEPRSFLREGNQFTYVYLERFDTQSEAIRARDSKYYGRYTDEMWILRVVGN